MKSYRTFHHDLNEGAKWAFLKNAFEWVKKRLISVVKKLGFGQTVRIPLKPPNFVMESIMCNDNQLNEAVKVRCQGGPIQPILGIYGEWTTAMHVYKLFDKINAKRHTFNYDKKEMMICAKEIARRKKVITTLMAQFEDPNWDGNFSYIEKNGEIRKRNAFKEYPDCWETYFTSIRDHWMDYEPKSKLGAEGIVKILLEHMEDHEIATFRFDMTGQGGGKGDEGSADIIIEKMDKDEVVKSIRLSLKTLMHGVGSSLGTTLRGWFQALCYVADIETNKVAQSYWMDPDFLSMLAKKYDKEMADFVKMMSDLDRECYQHIPTHKIIQKIPEEKWDDTKALHDWYQKDIRTEWKLYGPPTTFKTVNEAIEKFPEIFSKKQNPKTGEISIEATADMRKNYIRKVFGVGLNSMGALGWAKITEKIMSDPANKRKLIDYIMDRMEVGKGTYLVVSGTDAKKGHVVEIKKPSIFLDETFEKEKDNVDFKVRVEMKNAEKFRDFKPTKSTAGKLFEYLDDNTPQDFGSFFWDLKIPGQPPISWRWNMSAHQTGTAQLKVKGSYIQDSISISNDLVEDVMKKFGVAVKLD
tara:strand:+ start:116 stop:1861 length:1746 start_codon:yes stop_codon:yes gene_type:complete